MQPPRYHGRFAPSPTGPLHQGSLVAALASYLDARAAGGQWSLRIDDIDPPRAAHGAVTAILDCLARHHLVPDGPVLYQSQRGQHYDAALSRLVRDGMTFNCRCTRTALAPGGICIADCQNLSLPAEGTSLRIRVPRNTRMSFADAIRGEQQLALGEQCANFILRRRDGLYAYQLACAVDDASLGITHVIRGADLLESTHRQQFLQRCLGYTPPQYGHVNVVTDGEGTKLSKQTGAAPLQVDCAYNNLREALAHLGQSQPDTGGDIDALLNRATAEWAATQSSDK